MIFRIIPATLLAILALNKRNLEAAEIATLAKKELENSQFHQQLDAALGGNPDDELIEDQPGGKKRRKRRRAGSLEALLEHLPREGIRHALFARKACGDLWAFVDTTRPTPKMAPFKPLETAAFQTSVPP